MLQAVVDTNVLVSALLSDGPSRKILRLAASKELLLVSSPELMKELEKVLKRDFEYSEAMVQNVVDSLTTTLAFVEPSFKLEVIKKDPTDNKLLECAKATHADYLLSYDKHLSEIREYENTKITTPDSLLRKLGKR